MTRPDLESVFTRTWETFLNPSPPARAEFSARAEAGLVAAADEPILVFSVFDETHLARALDTAADLMRRADAGTVDEGLAAALDRRAELAGEENPDLLDYALMVFITHHPRGRLLTHAVPPVTLRNPELVAPSAPPEAETINGLDMADTLATRAAFAGGVLPTSDGLEWWREDPFANEHHTHWHVVYPFGGIPDGHGGVRFKDRQGEVFFYMHQQMLARYDAERRAVGLPAVEPLAQYATPIALGYDPGPYLQANLFFARQPQTRMVSLPTITVATLQRLRAALDDVVADQAYALATPKTMDPAPAEPARLGATIESSGEAATDAANRRPYGSVHNIGHNMIAGASADAQNPQAVGVMVTPATAIRDPAFWQWHKDIDDVYAHWQDKQPAVTFADGPPVRVRSASDVLLVFEDALPPEAVASPSDPPEWPGLATWATDAFGGDRWDDTRPDLTTTVLQTRMSRRDLVLADRVTTTPVDQLTHRPFVYVLRLENTAAQAVDVTVRIFLVPEAAAEERRAWIEMDKFVHHLAPAARDVVTRRGAQSSVILKPATMEPQVLAADTIHITQAQLDAMVAGGLPQSVADQVAPLVGRTVELTAFAMAVPDRAELTLLFRSLPAGAFVPGEQPRPPQGTPAAIDAADEQNYCTCGWPYNLLLPRGTTDGMAFRLLVVCTDHAVDQTPSDDERPCGSMSFCGARDQYPDLRPMGYPFDRPFPLGVTTALAGHPHIATTGITIQRV